MGDEEEIQITYFFENGNAHLIRTADSYRGEGKTEKYSHAFGVSVKVYNGIQKYNERKNYKNVKEDRDKKWTGNDAGIL